MLMEPHLRTCPGAKQSRSDSGHGRAVRYTRARDQGVFKWSINRACRVIGDVRYSEGQRYDRTMDELVSLFNLPCFNMR